MRLGFRTSRKQTTRATINIDFYNYIFNLLTSFGNDASMHGSMLLNGKLSGCGRVRTHDSHRLRRQDVDHLTTPDLQTNV